MTTAMPRHTPRFLVPLGLALAAGACADPDPATPDGATAMTWDAGPPAPDATDRLPDASAPDLMDAGTSDAAEPPPVDAAITDASAAADDAALGADGGASDAGPPPIDAAPPPGTLIVTPDPRDFRGTNGCFNGDADRGVVGVASFVLVENPLSADITILDLTFDDPRFTSGVSSVPIAAGETIGLSMSFEPTAIELTVAHGTFSGDGFAPTTFEVIGEGLPNDPPTLGACSVPATAPYSSMVPIAVEADDSATRANIASCRANLTWLEGPGTPGSPFSLTLSDDGTMGDVTACDGSFGTLRIAGGIWKRGVWEMTFDCTDKQGNVSSGGPACTITIL